jgi:hypothetical protein
VAGPELEAGRARGRLLSLDEACALELNAPDGN